MAFFSSAIFANEQPTKLKIQLLAENVYQHISYKEVAPYGMVAASGLVVVDGNNAHIIDTPWTQEDTEHLITWIQAKGLTIKSGVASHFHEDASSGIPLLNKAQIKTYATPLTNHLLSLNDREKSSDEITSNPFELVKNSIEIFYPGAGHTQDNIVVWLPKAKILFGGCFVKSRHSKTLGNIEDALINSWPDSINKLINQYPSIKVVVPGHGRIGDINLLKHTAKLAMAKQI